MPRAWGSGRSAWNQALVSSWRGRGPRPTASPCRGLGLSPSLCPFPADASGAYRPNPQATTELAPGPSSLKGYLIRGNLFEDLGNSRRHDSRGRDDILRIPGAASAALPCDVGGTEPEGRLRSSQFRKAFQLGCQDCQFSGSQLQKEIQIIIGLQEFRDLIHEVFF